MFFKRVYDTDLAQASYIVGCQKTGEAIVIDARRDADTFIALAAKEGLTVTAVTETHIHADYLSGSRELAYRTGAKLYLSDEGGADWSYSFDHIGLKDGSKIQVGNIVIEAVHTPGHTPEHVSFLITDMPRSPEPVMMLTGDFVFVGDLGRPDLLDEAAGGIDTRFVGAKLLFKSLKEKFVTLPEHVQIWPGHGSGSACGKALGAVESSTVGYERKFSWWTKYINTNDEAGFTAELLEGQPDAPLYFGRMKVQNKGTVNILGEIAPLQELSASEAQSVLVSGAKVLDSRSRSDFQNNAVVGSIHLPLGNTFETWAGWLLRPETAYILLAADAQTAQSLRERLWQIGADNIVGFVTSTQGLDTAPQAAKALNTVGNLNQYYILDVRNKTEYSAGHIPEAHQLHSGRLLWNLDQLPKEKPILLHCQSGARSAAAASMLRSEGFDNISELAGGYAAYTRALQQV